jgi:hypothetical protein
MFFTLPEPSSDDVKLITILEQAFIRFEHLPPDRLRAIVAWFGDFADAKLDEIESEK